MDSEMSLKKKCNLDFLITNLHQLDNFFGIAFHLYGKYFTFLQMFLNLCFNCSVIGRDHISIYSLWLIMDLWENKAKFEHPSKYPT